MKKIKFPILALALVFLLTSLLAQSSQEQLTIVVQDPAGAPIPNASVHVQHWEAPPSAKPQLLSDGASVTDKEGRATFAVVPREYEVHASASAFVPVVRSVRVSRGGQAPYTFTLSVQTGGGVEVEGPPKAR